MDPILSGAIFRAKNMNVMRSPAHLLASLTSNNNSNSKISSNNMASKELHHTSPSNGAGSSFGEKIIKKKFDEIYRATPIPMALHREKAHSSSSSSSSISKQNLNDEIEYNNLNRHSTSYNSSERYQKRNESKGDSTAHFRPSPETFYDDNNGSNDNFEYDKDSDPFCKEINRVNEMIDVQINDDDYYIDPSHKTFYKENNNNRSNNNIDYEIGDYDKDSSPERFYKDEVSPTISNKPKESSTNENSLPHKVVFKRGSKQANTGVLVNLIPSLGAAAGSTSTTNKNDPVISSKRSKNSSTVDKKPSLTQLFDQPIESKKSMPSPINNTPKSSHSKVKIKGYISSQKNKIDSNNDDVVCACCLDGRVTKSNNIIHCDRCNVPVHQLCYGVTPLPKNDWYCNVCKKLKRESGKSPSAKEKSISCELCKKGGGAMKATDDAKWVHVLCAYFIPEISDKDEKIG